MAEEQDRPLSHKCFQQWVRDDFNPHIEREHTMHDQLIKVEESIKGWVKVIGVAGSIGSLLIGIIITILVWGVNEKNAEFIGLREAQVHRQETLTMLVTKQQTILIEIERNRDRDEKLAELIARLQNKMLQHVQQGHHRMETK